VDWSIGQIVKRISVSSARKRAWDHLKQTLRKNDLSYRRENTMAVIIRPIGQLKGLLSNQSEITVRVGRTVRETLTVLEIKPEIVAGVVVNGVLQSKDYILQEDDDVKLFAVVGGG
jgi:sulfur carrier protein ThiS